jgi:cephalosporin-C deacetylase-like acetyl esterase
MIRHVEFALGMFVAVANTASAAPLDASAFAYDANTPLHVAYSVASKQSGVVVRDVTFVSPTGHKIVGSLAAPAGSARSPGVLFVHWLGDPPTTNHTEFSQDQIALAKRGITSLAIDAMWAQPKWFESVRTTQSDYANSIAQVIDLRRSLDVLMAQPNIDGQRVAYVGHDFGAMYGAVLAGVDPRPRYYVLMAGTTTFSEWYLLGKKPADVPAYVKQMTPLDPPQYLARAKAAFLFQFSAHDEYVKAEKANAFFNAAPLPRGMFMYDTDHSLATPTVQKDRLTWLEAQLL